MTGLRVESVAPDGVGAEAGIHTGDLIIASNWRPTGAANPFIESLRACEENLLLVQRGQTLRHVTVGSGRLGIGLRQVARAAVAEVVVLQVSPEGIAQAAGLQPSDRIVSINEYVVMDQRDVHIALVQAPSSRVGVRRGTRLFEIVCEGAELGVRLGTVEPLGLGVGRLVLTGCPADSKGAAAGLRVGDICLELNGEVIGKPKVFAQRLSASDGCVATVLRDNAVHQIRLPRGPLGVTVESGVVRAEQQAARGLPGLQGAEVGHVARVLSWAPQFVALKIMLAFGGAVAGAVADRGMYNHWLTDLATALSCLFIAVAFHKPVAGIPRANPLRKAGRQIQILAGCQALAELVKTLSADPSGDPLAFVPPYIFGLFTALIVISMLDQTAKKLGGAFPKKQREGGIVFACGLLLPILLPVGLSLVLSTGPAMAKHLQTHRQSVDPSTFD